MCEGLNVQRCKNCSIKEKEMNEAFDNANNYSKEEEEKKGKGLKV